MNLQQDQRKGDVAIDNTRVLVYSLMKTKDPTTADGLYSPDKDDGGRNDNSGETSEPMEVESAEMVAQQGDYRTTIKSSSVIILPPRQESVYDFPWLVKFLSLLRRRANRRRIANAPCFNPYRILFRRNPFPIDRLFPPKMDLGIFRSSIKTVSSRLLDNVLHNFEATKTPIPAFETNDSDEQSKKAYRYSLLDLLQGKAGTFLVRPIGNASARAEARKRELKAIVPYQPKSSASQDIAPEVWNAAFLAACCALQYRGKEQTTEVDEDVTRAVEYHGDSNRPKKRHRPLDKQEDPQSNETNETSSSMDYHSRYKADKPQSSPKDEKTIDESSNTHSKHQRIPFSDFAAIQKSREETYTRSKKSSKRPSTSCRPGFDHSQKRPKTLFEKCTEIRPTMNEQAEKVKAREVSLLERFGLSVKADNSETSTNAKPFGNSRGVECPQMKKPATSGYTIQQASDDPLCTRRSQGPGPPLRCGSPSSLDRILKRKRAPDLEEYPKVRENHQENINIEINTSPHSHGSKSSPLGLRESRWISEEHQVNSTTARRRENNMSVSSRSRNRNHKINSSKNTVQNPGSKEPQHLSRKNEPQERKHTIFEVRNASPPREEKRITSHNTTGQVASRGMKTNRRLFNNETCSGDSISVVEKGRLTVEEEQPTCDIGVPQSLKPEQAHHDRLGTSKKDLKRERKRFRKEEKKARKKQKRDRKKKIREETSRETMGSNREVRSGSLAESMKIGLGEETRQIMPPLRDSSYKAQSGQGCIPQEYNDPNSQLVPETIRAQEHHAPQAAADTRCPSSLSPIQFLCSESFIETWGDVVGKLATGEWASSFGGDHIVELDQDPLRPTKASKKICFLDTSLVDTCGVDIETPNRGGIIVSALSSWQKSGVSSLIKRIVNVASTSRYKFLEVFLCADIDLNLTITENITKLQNAVFRTKGNPPTVVCFKMVSPRSMADCIAHALSSQESSTENFNKIEDMISNDRVRERIIFLLSIIPSLAVGGALRCLTLVDQDQSDDGSQGFQRLLGKNQMTRKRVESAARCQDNESNMLHPGAMIQLSFALSTFLGKRKGST